MFQLLSNTTVTRKDRLRTLQKRENGYFDLQFIRAMEPEHRNLCIDLLDQSRSQLRQDLFALSQAEFKRDGFFIEFGATDGVELNNTVLMEQAFGWSGILAEPARGWQANLKCVFWNRLLTAVRNAVCNRPNDAHYEEYQADAFQGASPS